MCTVTYLPKEEKNYILTSNRDEATARKTIFPNFFSPSLIGPKDEVAGGTWIATTQTRTTCLLNGAFEKHVRKLPYRKSRGQVVLDVFEYQSIDDFKNTYDFSNIENFTLVIIDIEEEKQVHEFRWDGSTLHYQELNSTKAHLWASPTLYNPEIIATRKKWFEEWQQTNNFTLENIRKFHQFGGNGDKENGLQINRKEGVLQTVSITSVENFTNQLDVHYLDMLTQETQKEVL